MYESISELEDLYLGHVGYNNEFYDDRTSEL